MTLTNVCAFFSGTCCNILTTKFTFPGKVDCSFLVLGTRAFKHRTKTEGVVKMVSGAIVT